MNDATKREDSFEATQARHFAQCVKEAKVCTAVWISAWIVCATIVGIFGYLPPEQRPDDPWLVLGMPARVVFGVIIPWLCLIVLTIWFALFYLKEDEPCQDFPGTKKAADSRQEAGDE